MSEMIKIHAIYNGSYANGVIANEYLEQSAIWRDSDIVAIEQSDGIIEVKKNCNGEAGVVTKEEWDKIAEKYLGVSDKPTEGNKNGY